MAVTLTSAAQQRVREYLDKRGHGLGLRLGVKLTGCSGYAYDIGYADEEVASDTRFVSNDVVVYVTEEAMKYIDGTEVDFVKEGLNQMFKFRNPNIKDECGCGESFTIE